MATSMPFTHGDLVVGHVYMYTYLVLRHPNVAVCDRAETLLTRRQLPPWTFRETNFEEDTCPGLTATLSTTNHFCLPAQTAQCLRASAGSC